MSLAAYFHTEAFGIQVSSAQSSRSYAWESPFSLIKENNGLHEDDVIAGHMIPATFHEETENQVIAPSKTKMTKMLEMIRLIISNAYFYRKENSDYRRKMINIQKRF
jgi:hypothetical protein